MDISENFYPEYPCSRNAPFNCDRPTETAREVKGAKFCLDCGFPAILALPAQIDGQQGNYQVTSFLGVRGMSRLYAGVRMQDDRPVTIEEYLLPDRTFSIEESQQIKDTFTKVAGVSLADGRVQNFRLIQTWEAIADRTMGRCYAIAHSLPNSVTLSQYLHENSVMSAERVREVLNQILQTLEFLHTQKLRLPSNQVRPGLAHGNLNLDSILIEVKNERDFDIYLCDLALWQHLFIPAQISSSKKGGEASAKENYHRDLIALGTTAAQLWGGKQIDFKNDDWGQSDPPLRAFIQQLSGAGTPFENARLARLALLKLPKIDGEKQLDSLSTSDSSKNSHWKKLGIVGGISGLLLLICVAIWFALNRNSTSELTAFRAWYDLLAGFSDVNGVPVGEFTYTAEKDGSWTNVLTLKPQSDRTLQELFTKPKPDIAATFTYEPIASPNIETSSKPIDTVVADKQPKNFAITSLTGNIPAAFDRQKIAYDGLIVFVAFSKKATSLPKALNGKITIEQLRQIYTGKLTNWQQLNGTNLPIKPSAPTELEALQLFKKLILKDDPEDIVLFNNTVSRTATETTQQQILKEFDEERAGIIGFGTLSKTWNQCSGYPLAIVNGEKQTVQVLFRLDGKPINPADNLCDKNNYLNVDSFQSGRYPLGYPVYVVYPKDNTLPPAGTKFAEVLKTRQGQCLLSKVGLVPLQPMPEKYLKSNVCK